MAAHKITVPHCHLSSAPLWPSPRLITKPALKRQCAIAPLCGTEGSSMNNSPRSSEWHSAFPQYYSVYTPNMTG